jgi:DNA-binding GntR family transcriptional regulator
MDRLRRLSIQGHLDVLVQDHLHLADAVATGDTDGAARIMSAHLRRVLLDLPEIRGNFPQYFDPQTPHGEPLFPGR